MDVFGRRESDLREPGASQMTISGGNNGGLFRTAIFVFKSDRYE
jgi:hypothetical protein